MNFLRSLFGKKETVNEVNNIGIVVDAQPFHIPNRTPLDYYLKDLEIGQKVKKTREHDGAAVELEIMDINQDDAGLIVVLVERKV